MKKPFITAAIIILFSSCHNSSSPKFLTTGKDSSLPASEGMVSQGGGCSSFSWFKKGAVMEYNLTDSTGRQLGRTTTSINRVFQDGQSWVADYTTSFDKGNSINAMYRCDGDKLYVNLKSLFDDSFGNTLQTGMDVEMTDAFLSFPSNMKTGDRLDGAGFEIKARKNGEDFMTIRNMVKNRKVETTEKITTPAGSWNCVKLTEIRSTITEVRGTRVSTKDIRMSQWFTPVAGLVKSESYDEEGNLDFRSELISLKN